MALPSTEQGSATGKRAHRRGQRGAVLLIALIFILVMTMGATTLVEVQQTAARREREQELLFVGDQYRRAISSYYAAVPPGGTRALPRSIEDLLSDNRFATPLHHLRRAYPDPMTGQLDWILILGPGGFVGVRSRVAEEAIKKTGFPRVYSQFEGSHTYAEWTFSAVYP